MGIDLELVRLLRAWYVEMTLVWDGVIVPPKAERKTKKRPRNIRNSFFKLRM